MAESRAAVRQIALTFGAVTLAAVAISRVGSAPPLDAYVHVAVAALFLWTALHLAQKDPRGAAWYGLALGGWFAPLDATNDGVAPSLIEDIRRSVPLLLRELWVAVAVAIVVFPPFALAFAYWHEPSGPLTLSLPDDVLSFVLAQVLVVGLPEEALFRGYFQSRLTDVVPHVFRIGRTQLPWLAIVLQALLFALVHFAVDLELTRLSVFFPGLLFGVMRAVRGGIGAAVFFHALCNLYSDVLVRGWL